MSAAGLSDGHIGATRAIVIEFARALSTPLWEATCADADALYEGTIRRATGVLVEHWPNCANPYLLVSRRTAPRLVPVGHNFPWKGITLRPQALREDRILHEIHAHRRRRPTRLRPLRAQRRRRHPLPEDRRTPRPHHPRRPASAQLNPATAARSGKAPTASRLPENR
jgi:hypothetical protein